LDGDTTTGVDLGIDGLVDPVLIGQGGFGAVYRAQQPSLGRAVAVKILSASGLDDRTRDRFTRECVAIGTLSGHPHIVTVYDSGINGWGRPYIVMDHMARGSAADRVAHSGAMPWQEAVDLAIKISGAVATAHSASILHRDIKPPNVLISSFDEPKLGDFGISSIGGSQTSSGTITASLEHAAPELLDGSPASVQTDVYALASTVYTLISGSPPFARGDDEPVQSLIARIVTKPVPDLRPRGVPGVVCDILERALAKDPAERHASAAEFAGELRNAQEMHGLAPTEFVQAVVGTIEPLEWSRPVAGTTGPTRARERAAFVPPAPPVAEAPFWKRRAFVAIVLAIVVALGTSAFAITRAERDGDGSRPTAAAVAATPSAEPADDAIAEAPETDDRKRRDDKQQKERGNGTRAGSGGSAGGVPPLPAPVPDSAGSGGGAAPAQPPSTEGGGGSEGRGNSGTNDKKEEQPPPEPQLPPPPRVWLYHVWKGQDHVATTNPAAYPSDYARKAEGLVYNYPEEGTTPIATAEGTMYAFTESHGDTDPDVHRYLLYKMTKGSEYFYTTNMATKQNYHARFDWAFQASGYAGRTE
jgi:hypothetical protein